MRHSFEHPNRMLKLISKNIFTILHSKVLFGQVHEIMVFTVNILKFGTFPFSVHQQNVGYQDGNHKMLVSIANREEAV